MAYTPALFSTTNILLVPYTLPTSESARDKDKDAAVANIRRG
jgi:hypothetical protein